MPSSEAGSPPTVARWTVVGSGTLLPDARRGSAAHVLEAGTEVILLDCGAGTLHGLARAGLPWQAIRRVWISHFHADHLADLPGLAWAWEHGGRSVGDEAVEVIGPPGIRERWGKMVEAFGPWMSEPGGRLTVREVSGPGAIALGGGLEMTTLETRHTPESRAIRVRGGGGDWSVVYTSDAVAGPALVPFMREASLVVAACAVPDPPGDVSHLSPGGLAPLLEEAGVRTVVTTHAYPGLPADEVPDLLKEAGYTGHAIAGRDGLAIDLNRVHDPTYTTEKESVRHAGGDEAECNRDRDRAGGEHDHGHGL